MNADKRDRDRRYNAKRPPWVAWYKTPEWREIRRRQFEAEPHCRMCAARGQRVAATTVDHVKRHGGDRAIFFAGPFQSLCDHHHDSIKQSMERGNRAGCGVDGLPTDPSHPWA